MNAKAPIALLSLYRFPVARLALRLLDLSALMESPGLGVRSRLSEMSGGEERAQPVDAFRLLDGWSTIAERLT